MECIADDEDEEMIKEKVVGFLNTFHVVKNAKKSFKHSSDKGAVFCDWRNANLPSNYL